MTPVEKPPLPPPAAAAVAAAAAAAPALLSLPAAVAATAAAAGRSASSSPEPSALRPDFGAELAPEQPASATPRDVTTELELGPGLALTLREDVRTGCGGRVWPAGVLLATWAVRARREELAGARILEIGAGGGLVGLAVAKGCELEHGIVITDQEAMLALMEHNIRLNKLEHKATAMVLDWGQPLPPSVTALRPTVILAADCVYLESTFPLLLGTLTDLLELNGEAVVYFCFQKRRRADMQFIKGARRAFAVREVEDEDRAGWARRGLHLLEFRRK